MNRALLVSPAAAPAAAARPLSPRTRLLLEAPLLPTLLRLAAPNLMVVVVQVASGTVDALFVARLGAEALAGVSLVFPLWMLMVTMSAGGIGGGIASAVARALGAGRRADADHLLVHALLIALVLAGAFTAVGLLAGPDIFRALGGSGSALAAALAYARVAFAGALAVWLVNALASVLRGSGEMLVPAVVVVSGELLHIVLAPALIFGVGPVPPLGVRGAAISLTTSYTLRAAALAAYVLARRALVGLPRDPFHLRAALFWEILRVGLPGSANTVLTSLTVMATTALVASFGTFALAAYGVATRLEYLLIPLVFGLGTALVTLVGTSAGAGAAARARRAAWTGAGLAAAATGAAGLLVALLPNAWLGLFSGQPQVLTAGATYLRIVGPGYAWYGLGLAFYFASQGVGRVIWPLAVSAVVRVLVVAGGWVAITWLGGGLPALFAAIALGFLALGIGQAAAFITALRGAHSAPRSAHPRTGGHS